MQVTNMNTFPVSTKIVTLDANGNKVVDYVTVMSKGKVNLPPDNEVHANWLVMNPKVLVKTPDDKE